MGVFRLAARGRASTVPAVGLVGGTMPKRPTAALLLALALGLAFAGPVQAEDKPLHIVVGLPAGASIDTITRLIAEKMRVSLDRPLVGENKPGAGGLVANLAVKAAAPDRNTLLIKPLANMLAVPPSYAQPHQDPFHA